MDISRIEKLRRTAKTLAFYRNLSDLKRAPQGIDLTRIHDECQYHIDYPEIARHSEAYFA